MKPLNDKTTCSISVSNASLHRQTGCRGPSCDDFRRKCSWKGRGIVVSRLWSVILKNSDWPDHENELTNLNFFSDSNVYLNALFTLMHKLKAMPYKTSSSEKNYCCCLSVSLKDVTKLFRGWRIWRFTCGVTQERSRTCASIQAVRKHSATPATGQSTSAHTWTLWVHEHIHSYSSASKHTKTNTALYWHHP